MFAQCGTIPEIKQYICSVFSPRSTADLAAEALDLLVSDEKMNQTHREMLELQQSFS